jgi:hypothetical protein
MTILLSLVSVRPGGTTIGSILGFGRIDIVSVLLGMLKGAAKGGKYDELVRNVVVCGSGTGEGLYQVTLSPTLISTLCGE